MPFAFAKSHKTRWNVHAAGLTLQIMLLILGSGLTIAPPSTGTILVAPLPGIFASDISWAWRAGAVPVARGPYSGSYVVRGSLSALLLPALAHGSVLVTARFTDCSNAATKDS